eukprot:TRINITY_DN36601_c0_g1_i1.p1 TRINITY_DN36601_c0_g1~~TRINITY_DN36601_c0_g1_i1.p1  ORF type:complete len:676 (-),score=156.89 TRINITY_DN36601_c0_g1_i1:291-2135(-)
MAYASNDSTLGLGLASGGGSSGQLPRSEGSEGSDQGDGDQIDESEINAFFEPVFNHDQGERHRGLESITSTLRGKGTRFVNEHLPTLMRLASEAPYSDVRDALGAYVEECRTSNEQCAEPAKRFNLRPNTSESPSIFFPRDSLRTIDDLDEKGRAIVEEYFLTTGRVSNLVRVLFFHSEYLTHWAESVLAVMYAPGPLPPHLRHYVAMMAASRHGCRYLVRRQRAEFLYAGGNRKWIAGVQFADTQVQRLAQLNTMLALRPWRLEKEHIDSLLSAGADSWSVAELVHILTIYCMYHSLSCLCFALGVVPDIDDTETGEDMSALDNFGDMGEALAHNDYVHTTVEEALNLIKQIPTAELPEGNEALFEQAIDEQGRGAGSPPPQTGSSAPASNTGSGVSSAAGPAGSGVTGTASSSQADNSAGASSVADGEGDRSSHGNAPNFVRYNEYLGQEYVDEKHEDFQVKSKTYEVFRVQDYSWSDDGYPLLNRFYPGVAPLLDAKFKFIYRMSDNSFGTTDNVDTLPFRRAIWYYVHRVYGIFHDDYNYNEVNKILNRQIKIFIKKVTTAPEDVTRTDFVNLGYDFRHDEIVHIALLTIEARQQAELLYGLRAIMKHMA